MFTILAGGTAMAQKLAVRFWIAPSAHKVMRDEVAPAGAGARTLKDSGFRWRNGRRTESSRKMT